MPQKHPTIDEKGLDAAEAAWRASVEPTCKLMLRTAIRAYLSTVALPDELEGGLADDLRSASRKVKALKEYTTLAGAAKTTLHRLAETSERAADTIAALRRDHELVVTLRNQVEAAHRQLDAAEAEVKRLTEENEGLRAKNAVLDADGIAARRATAKHYARIKALEDALGNVIRADDANTGAEPSVSVLARAIDDARQALSGSKE